MKDAVRQQIVISGVGGQGVLFVTRLLAEAAMGNGFSVMTSETHGMAQRGGTVVSHLKVGTYHSPMIRPGTADGLIALKGETLEPFRPLLGPNGWVAVNCVAAPAVSQKTLRYLDADGIAASAGYPRSVNLVMLGLAVHLMETLQVADLFCTFKGIRNALSLRLKDKKEMLALALEAFATGYHHSS